MKTSVKLSHWHSTELSWTDYAYAEGSLMLNTKKPLHMQSNIGMRR